MDIGKIKQKLTEFIKKYKYAALILALGLLLMTLPGKTPQEQTTSQTIPSQTQNQMSVSEQLAQILTTIDGVGRVEVMLTVSMGEQTVYQTDGTTSNKENESSSRHDTVIITDSNKNQQGLITQVLPEKYQGAIIVCQGAESPSVRLAVIEAVANVTGLGSDRICVLKMK